MNEILLYGSVGESFWGESFFTAKSTYDQLAQMRGDVTVRINSGGGSATEGAAIYAALSSYNGRITVVIDGVAASSASLIAMAGDEIVMSEGAWMLIHDPAVPFVEGRGTSADHDRAAQMLDVIGQQYAEIYARRTGNAVEEVRRLMVVETIMGGEAAVQMGFATRVDIAIKTTAAAQFDYRIYANAPRALRMASESLGAVLGKEAILAMWAGSPVNWSKGMNAQTQTVSVEANSAASQSRDTAADRTRMRRILSAASAAGMSAEDAMGIVDSEMKLEDALSEITMRWKQKGDADIPMMGAPSSRIGRDFNSPFEMAMTQGDAIAAKLAPQLGVKFEPTRGRALMDHSIVDMKASLLEARGVRTRGLSAVDMATHSSSDFPLAIGGGLTAVLGQMMQQMPVALEKVAREIEADDYRTGNSVTLTGTGVPKRVSEGGEIGHTTINEMGEAKAVPDDFGQIFRLSNQALVNDARALGLLADITRLMMKGATELKRQTLLSPLVSNSGLGQTMRDGNTLFHASHGNLAASGAAISIATLSAARTAMRRQKDTNGSVLNVEPAYLVVPPEKETEANQIVAQISAAAVADVNPFSTRLEVVTEAGLSNVNAWYLAADPMLVDGLTFAYLSGQRNPVVEAKDGWETLGMEMRLVWAIGAALHGYQGWYRNPGV